MTNNQQLEMQKISYVYVIQNKINNKIYIGKSNDPHKRFKDHVRSKGYIGNAIKHYGKENFTFQILEEHPTEQDAFEAEQFFIQYLNSMSPSGYNLNAGGLGGTNPSLLTRQKISKASKDRCPRLGCKDTKETKELKSLLFSGVGNPMYGKHHSVETKKKISNANKGKKRTQEEKERIRIILTGRKHTAKTKEKLSKKTFRKK